MITREQIVERARSFIGLKWKHQGRNRKGGIDCGGLIICVGRELGILDHRADVFGYTIYPDGVTLAATCRKFMQEKIKDPEPGDVVLMKPRLRSDSSWPCHLGIVGRLPTGELSLIHSFGNRVQSGSVKETLYGPWGEKVVGVFSYKGVG
jgi:hypothetical protein